MFFFLALFGLASSRLPYQRKCDPEPIQQTPTLCSNYKNTLKLDEKQIKLQQRTDAVEGKLAQHLKTQDSTLAMLKRLETNISSAQKELEKLKLQTEKGFKDTKAQLQKHNVVISSLKREIHELGKYKERVGENITEIEKKLDITERQLKGKKAKLENLEKETKGAFNDTHRLLNLYKNGLSQLNTTTQELEDKVVQLNTTKTDLGTELKKIQDNNEGNF